MIDWILFMRIVSQIVDSPPEAEVLGCLVNAEGAAYSSIH